jgi:hypothetical protein
MELKSKRELAFLYIQGELSDEGKKVVFELILTDRMFVEMLKEELEVRERMKSLRTLMEPSAKSRLLASIKVSAKAEKKVAERRADGEPAWLSWSDWALKLTLPPLIYPIMNKLQRRVLV